MANIIHYLESEVKISELGRWKGREFLYGFILLTGILVVLAILNHYFSVLPIGIVLIVGSILWCILLIDYLIAIFRKSRESLKGDA